jgi:hypothetical protein
MDQKTYFELVTAAEYVRDHRAALFTRDHADKAIAVVDYAFEEAAKKVAKHLLESLPRMEGRVKYLPEEGGEAV